MASFLISDLGEVPFWRVDVIFVWSCDSVIYSDSAWLFLCWRWVVLTWSVHNVNVGSKASCKKKHLQWITKSQRLKSQRYEWTLKRTRNISSWAAMLGILLKRVVYLAQSCIKCAVYLSVQDHESRSSTPTESLCRRIRAWNMVLYKGSSWAVSYALYSESQSPNG